jgi:citrate synthase
MKKRYLTAAEVTELLGITPATLYAYVSRGLIRSESVEGDSRARRYHTEDALNLKERKAQRQNPARAAENALDWGTPLLDSALTLITDDHLYYRGCDALALARDHTIEQVAALLWRGSMAQADALFARRNAPASVLEGMQSQVNLSLVQRLYIALALASEDDLLAYDLSAPNVAATGARILGLMAAVLANRQSAEAIVPLLRAGWCAERPDAEWFLNAALILCADHELNVSSFTARVVASAETPPYGVVIAGLAALQGVKHGGNTEQVEALLREIREPADARTVIVERLRRGERIPGFGHKLYHDSDPRAHFLLDALNDAYPDAEVVRLAAEIIRVLRETLDLAPNVDFALVLVARLFDLPRGAALGLFALGRTIGWIGHAIEQYETKLLIRPRARYTGIPPRAENDIQGK